MEEQIPKYKGMHPGKIIEHEYIKRNVSQRELAAKIGVHYQTLNAVINGRRKLTAELSYRLDAEFGFEYGTLYVLQAYYEIREYHQNNTNSSRYSSFTDNKGKASTQDCNSMSVDLIMEKPDKDLRRAITGDELMAGIEVDIRNSFQRQQQTQIKCRVEMNNIQVLEVRYESGGRTGMIYPVIISDKESLMLVDAGLVGQRDILENTLQRIGISFSQLTHIFITHHDHDHVGSLRAIKDKYPHIKIVSSEVEGPFVDKSEKSPRLIQAESIYPTLPEELKEGAKRFHQFLESIEPATVDIKVIENGVLEFMPDVEVIMTPGHTPGHASLYHKPTRTIIAGDAITFENGHLDIANPRYTLDMRSALESIGKLAGYDARRIICYHGGVFEGDCRETLLQILDKYKESRE